MRSDGQNLISRCLYCCAVERAAGEEHGSTANLLWFSKTGLAHQTKNSGFRIVFQAVVGVQQVGEEAVAAVLGTFEIEQVEFASRFENATHLLQRFLLFLVGKVVEHERGEHAVE